MVTTSHSVLLLVGADFTIWSLGSNEVSGSITAATTTVYILCDITSLDAML
jgi:hypothetical protein